MTYQFLDKKKIKYLKVPVLLLVLLGNFFVFPSLFYPAPDPSGSNCGILATGMILGFWILGGGTAILIHIIYFIKNTLISRLRA